MVSGFGAHATNAIAAKTSSQFDPIIHHDCRGSISSSSRRSSGDSVARSIAAAALLVSTVSLIERPYLVVRISYLVRFSSQEEAASARYERPDTRYENGH